MELYDRREESISRSCEGSDIVFENLLGDLISRTDGKTPRQCTDDIDDIFDDDLFEVSKDEMEKHSIYLLTDVDDEEEESESVEGVPDVTTSPIKPAQIDVFDSILLDLDEKTKEMEKQEMTKKETKETRKRRRKKKRRRKHLHSHSSSQSQCKSQSQSFHCKQLQRIHLIQDDHDHDTNRHLICRQTECDKQMIQRKGEVLNPWRLRQWEFDSQHHRRTLRTLLVTLDGDLLWNEIMDSKEGWEVIKRKDIVYDEECFAMFERAQSVFHCDKSRERGDSISQQIVCQWIYEALQKAHRVMRAKSTT